jgi:hypothetical protein
MSRTVSNDSMEIGSNETINTTRNQIFHETMVCFNKDDKHSIKCPILLGFDI